MDAKARTVALIRRQFQQLVPPTAFRLELDDGADADFVADADGPGSPHRPALPLICLPDVQERLFAEVFADLNVEENDPPARYAFAVLKKINAAIEAHAADDVEVSEDILGALVGLMSAVAGGAGVSTDASPVRYSFDRPDGGEDTIRISEVRTLISGFGSTGLRTWEAALALGEHLLAGHGPQVAGRRVLELGAGSGFVGLLCSKLGAASVALTDGSPEVVGRLAGNIAANGVANVSAGVLRWGAGDEDHAVPGGVDVVLGADLTYDAVLGALLAHTLAAALAASPRAEIVIAATVRSAETVGAFEAALAAHGLSHTHTVARPAPRFFYYAASPPIRIYTVAKCI
ncbi:putative methyltransferase-domain-containing protein [Dipodascopsis tothii]|uniref:putative methyltransferase-domain-containing protein n=1 Tax=Dipodascopsis tothii TaxID=44089 RepID=UPI0034CE175C